MPTTPVPRPLPFSLDPPIGFGCWLLDRDPDLIVLTYGWFEDESFDDAQAEFEALPGVADLTAVREDRVFGLHYSQAEPQPEVIGGIEQLAAWITGLS